MSNVATYGIAITAGDQTAKGVASATKRVSGIVKHVGKQNELIARRSELSIIRSGGSMVRVFGQVEKATARAFGTTSLTSGLAGRIGGVTQAASSLGEGLGAAATAGGVLEGAMLAVGVTAAATIGVLAAGAFAAFKLADGWSKGAQSIGNLAQTIGVATDDLQAFTAAAERAGVSKDSAAGAIGGLSQTLNDARYGRNQTAIAALAKSGVKMQLNADGTVNTVGMMPAISNAIAHQNSSGRRTLATALGIPLDALPAFAQGGKALNSDMVDAGKHGPVISDAGIAVGARVARKRTIGTQMLERGMNAAGEKAATVGEGALDAANDAGRGIIDGSRSFTSTVKDTFKPAVSSFDRAIQQLLRDTAPPGAARPGRVSPLGAGYDGSFASAIKVFGEHSRDNQVSPKGARGSMQVMPSTAHRPGMGIRPAGDESVGEYNRVGTDYANALLSRYGGDRALAAAAYNAGPAAVDRWIKKNGDPRKGQISDAAWIAKIPGGGYQETRDYAARVFGGHGSGAGTSLAAAAAREHLHVTVELVNAPHGTKAKVKSKSGGVSYAMAH